MLVGGVPDIGWFCLSLLSRSRLGTHISPSWLLGCSVVFMMGRSCVLESVEERWAVQFWQIRNYNFTYILSCHEWLWFCFGRSIISGTFISSDIFGGRCRFSSTADFSMVDISLTWGVRLLCCLYDGSTLRVGNRWGALSRSILADPKLQPLLAVTNGGIGIIFDFFLSEYHFRHLHLLQYFWRPL